ncbi:hypothetical protein BX666DRAFT_2030350 [Dichotomocladium elegans]|nr:hypothetical protein BX666DRAFT_2030350 [Dichotomocladium elegans]
METSTRTFYFYLHHASATVDPLLPTSSVPSVSGSMPSPTPTHCHLSDDLAPTIATAAPSAPSLRPWELTTSHSGKRKRGRPRDASRHQGKNWTFLTPTVWDVKRTMERPMVALLWPE